MLVMHLSQSIDHFVIWYHQPTFEHQESTFIVEVCVFLFGKLAITLQGRITLLSNLDISQDVGQGDEVIRAAREVGR